MFVHITPLLVFINTLYYVHWHVYACVTKYICIYKYSAISSDSLKHVNIVILRAPLSIVPYHMSRFCAQVLEIALKPFS